MHDDDDWYEAVVTEYEGRPLQKMALCPTCSLVKPIKAFQRAMTPAEAKYRGYSGERQVLIETEKCSACRLPRRRKPESFTNAELQRKARAGEIPQLLADTIAKQRAVEAVEAQRAAVRRRWDKAAAAQWQALVDDINEELHAVRQQQRYARTKAKTHGRVLAYTKGYCELLTKLRADLKIALRKGTKKPEHERWQDYFTAYERNIVAALWGDIEFKLRDAGLRPPHMFAMDRVSKVVVPSPPPAPKTQRPAKGTLITSPNPAAPAATAPTPQTDADDDHPFADLL